MPKRRAPPAEEDPPPEAPLDDDDDKLEMGAEAGAPAEMQVRTIMAEDNHGFR